MEEFFGKLEKLLEKKANGQQVIVRGGVGPLGLLGIAFVVMKLVGAVSWSWWWVLAPFWIPIAFVFILFILILIVAVIITCKYASNEATVEKNNTPTYTTTSTAEVKPEQLNTPIKTEYSNTETNNVKVENPVSEIKTKKVRKSKRKSHEQSKETPEQGINTEPTENLSGTTSEC